MNNELKVDLELLAARGEKLGEELRAVEALLSRYTEAVDELGMLWKGDAADALRVKMQRNIGYVSQLSNILRMGKEDLQISLRIYRENEEAVRLAVQTALRD